MLSSFEILSPLLFEFNEWKYPSTIHIVCWKSLFNLEMEPLPCGTIFKIIYNNDINLKQIYNLLFLSKTAENEGNLVFAVKWIYFDKIFPGYLTKRQLSLTVTRFRSDNKESPVSSKIILKSRAVIGARNHYRHKWPEQYFFENLYLSAHFLFEYVLDAINPSGEMLHGQMIWTGDFGIRYWRITEGYSYSKFTKSDSPHLYPTSESSVHDMNLMRVVLRVYFSALLDRFVNNITNTYVEA